MSSSYLRSVDSEYLSSEEFQIVKAAALPPRRISRRLSVLIRAINAMFFVVAGFSIIGPPIFGNILNIHFGVSSYGYGDAGIHRGDLLILKDVKYSRIEAGTVVLVHPLAGVYGALQLGSVTSHANPNQIHISVMGTSYNIGATESDVLGTKIRVVARVFPKIGNLLNFFVCNFVKFGFMFFVGIANLLVYISMKKAANRLHDSR